MANAHINWVHHREGEKSEQRTGRMGLRLGRRRLGGEDTEGIEEEEDDTPIRKC